MRSSRHALALGALLVILAQATAGAERLAFDARAEGGYAWNLNHATDDALAAGSPTTRLGGSGSLLFLRTEQTDAFLELAVDGTHYVDYEDLSSVREQARIGGMYALTPRSLISSDVRAGLRQYGDTDRNAIEVEANLAYRLRFTNWISGAAGYGFSHRDATVDTYDSTAHDGRADVFIGGWRAELGLRYALEQADTTLYMDVMTADTPAGRGRQMRAPTTTFGTQQVAYRERTLSHIGGVDLIVRPARWLRLGGTYRAARMDTSSGIAIDHQAAIWLRVQH